MHSFLVSQTLEMSACRLVQTCGHMFCDGQHDASQRCPSVGSCSTIKMKALQGEIEVTGVEASVTFRSISLARLLIADDVLTVNSLVIKQT